ncbi:MAG TPA: DUF2721 domain-containing protein [Paludibacteraceae bacterium]|nr:DUF2721 domain-containing protein [Paludibacteraceae bacterium]
MEELTLITPSVLFSAVSLILLAYTNRFLAYAQLVRTLKDRYEEDRSKVTHEQILNLKQRLNLSRLMQVFGTVSLLLCVVTMFAIYVGFQLTAVWIFGFGLLALIISLGLSIWEIIISSRALELYLGNMND